ncbi:MAG: hypothetical protein JSR46_01045 [Verrucomicrobia bacterium]|nr:hypothetical protein [Verrucomicrobiota bacterium]
MNRLENYNLDYLPVSNASEQKQHNVQSGKPREASKYIFLNENELSRCGEKVQSNIKPQKDEGITDRKIIKIKAREAEDMIVKQRPPLRRQLSASHLDITYYEKPAAKNGAIWHCVSWKHDTYGGKIYTFKKNPEYVINLNHNYRSPGEISPEVRKECEIYPAVELPEMMFLFLEADRQERLKSYYPDNLFITCRSKLKELGYNYQHHDLEDNYKRFDGDEFSLPDRTALLARWARLMEKHPTLPPLDIVSSEGIATDLEFVEAYMSHDGLLSSGKEFVHDQLTHLIPTLVLILSLTINNDTSCYVNKKFNSVKCVMQFYRKIMIAKDQLSKGIPWMDPEIQAQAKKNFPQIETVLGHLVDYMSAIPVPSDLPSSRQLCEERFFEGLGYITSPENFRMLHYWQRRYGPENVLTPLQMQELWQLITEIVTYVDEQKIKLTTEREMNMYKGTANDS